MKGEECGSGGKENFKKYFCEPSFMVKVNKDLGTSLISPGIMNPPFHCRGHGFSLWLGN